MITQMKGHGEKFTRQKEAAIIGLLTQPTFDEAAKFAQVSSTTLWRWQQDPGFQAEYLRARRQAMGRAMAQLQQASFTAVKTLKEIMEDPKLGLELVGKLIDMKRKNNAEHFAEVCNKFSFETGIRNEPI